MGDSRSEILSKMIGLLYPYIIMFGFYIIINGHNTPGGGFQGGAVLAAVFISKYLVLPIHDMRLESLQLVEKLFYILIILIPTLFLMTGLNAVYPALNVYYLVIMNSLIGVKVCCGLSIVFFRFVFYESE